MKKFRFVLLIFLLLIVRINKCMAWDIYRVENKDGVYITYMDVTTIEFQREVEVINSGDRYSGELTIPDYIAVPDWDDPNKYVQAKVIGIGNQAFYHNENLTRINLPENLKYISHQAFYLCTSLTQVNLPEHLVEIFDEAFKYCLNLKSVRITANEIYSNAFEECTNLEEITFSSSVSNVNSVFTNDKNIKRIIIEDGAGEIKFNGSCFAASTLDSVYAGKAYDFDVYPFNGVSKPVLGPQVTAIPPLYFANDNSTEIDISTISNRIQKIGRQAFLNSKITHFTLPTTVVKVCSLAFDQCQDLTIIDLTNSPSTISLEEGAFSNCPGLKTVLFLLVSAKNL